ncbi:cation-translocating P-type ATPase [Acidaminobacter sp. JC074]|uniref:heavy metal translocating P-type ATPase n=1 Tax=Acidaminobacter sp. JC074 TaxID=2530199 RepID=UPI001F1092EE|nr:cation-translocating P-type ATPase [Acidaminobacter sp. JC074]MCH4891060.1 cation-translocating P-type ATPase [Acidaminobacter sp. JC074]
MPNRNSPLMKINVIHTLEGRIRVHVRGLKYLGGVKARIIEELIEIEGLLYVEFSTISGNLLVKYDPFQLLELDVISAIGIVLGQYSLMSLQLEREEKNTNIVSERRLQEESVSTFTKRLLITSSALIAFTLKGYHRRMNGGFRGIMSLPSLLSLGLSTSIFKSGIDSLKYNKKPNADTLTMSAILVAVLTGRSMSALMTILLSDVAEWMTAYTMERTREAISDMLNVDNQNVYRVLEDGSLEFVPIEDIKVDDVVSIQTGEKLQIDGTVIMGQAYIDQSAITGEYFPVSRSEKEMVFAGTVLKSGQIHVKVENIGDDTTVSRIVHLVEDASSKKAQIQTYADRFSAQLIPLNFALAGIVFLATRSITRALSMLIIDYSCGVRLSTATALSACIHNAARNGVLIKGGNYIEAIANSDSVVLDKTGTMTEGKPRIISMIPFGDSDEKKLLEYAAAAEEDSAHPLAHAILTELRVRNYHIPKHGLTDVVLGRGVQTSIDERVVRVGNKKFMLENKINLEVSKDLAETLDKRGESIIFVAEDEQLIGIFGVHDALKENMKKALNRLRYLGVDDIRLLTGDVAFQAEKVAVRMNMDDYEYELLPEDKAHTVLQMQGNGATVMMIGDGVNDAPALAYSDVGIAIGNTRTDIAIESADVTITNDDPLLIPSTVVLVRKTMRVIRENFISVIGINTVGIVLSALGFLPVFWSSVLHNSSTIIVVLNSGRLLLHSFDRRIQQ